MVAVAVAGESEPEFLELMELPEFWTFLNSENSGSDNCVSDGNGYRPFQLAVMSRQFAVSCMLIMHQEPNACRRMSVQRGPEGNALIHLLFVARRNPPCLPAGRPCCRTALRAPSREGI